MEKLIITLAHTGNVPTKGMNPNTPISVREIVRDIQECTELGASIAHIHARDENGLPTSRREIFEQILQELDRQQVNVIRQLSTGARGGENSIAYRGQMLDLRTHMASLSTGSSNFPNSVNANSPELIEALAIKMRSNGIVPEIEVFDLAMIANAVRLQKKGILLAPLHFNLVLNVPGSIPGTPRNLLYMVESLPDGSTWTVTAAGRSHLQLITLAVAMGGNVRTGLEDVLNLEPDGMASNQMLVQRVVSIARAFGREIASPDETLALLNLN